MSNARFLRSAFSWVALVFLCSLGISSRSMAETASVAPDNTGHYVYQFNPNTDYDLVNYYLSGTGPIPPDFGVGSVTLKVHYYDANGNLVGFIKPGWGQGGYQEVLVGGMGTNPDRFTPDGLRHFFSHTLPGPADIRTEAQNYFKSQGAVKAIYYYEIICSVQNGGGYFLASMTVDTPNLVISPL